MFTWVPIHKEAVRKILEFTEPQRELLAILCEMEGQGLKVISLDDKGPSGPLPLGEIDPFTFFSSFNRGITEENRRDNWTFLKTRWGLQADVPDDFAGIPIVHNMKSWFFPYARKRDPNQVGLLWDLFRQAASNPIEQIDAGLFQQCIDLAQITANKLTIGLFWIAPDLYLPADRKTTAFAAEKGVAATPTDYESYRTWLDEVRSALGSDFPRISHDAHLWATEGGDDDEGGSDEEGPDPKQRRFWVIAPGSKAAQWNEFHEAGIIAIGWEGLTDLRQFRDKDGVRKALQKLEGVDTSKVNDTLSCWQFANVMQPGDVLFAKKGTRKVVGFGIVSGDYEYDASRPAFKHVRTVKWLGSGEWKLPDDQQLPLKTLTNITKYRELVDTIADLVGLDLDDVHPPVTPPAKPRTPVASHTGG